MVKGVTNDTRLHMASKLYRNKDPFNPQNTIECDLSMTGGKYYGMMGINKVNGKKIDQQIIYGTPKLEYPFGRSGKYHFPSAKDEYISYKKYDGTNVFLYYYADDKGMIHITYKVRIFPFLRGRFIPLWKRMINKYKIELTTTLLWNLNMHEWEGKTYSTIRGFSFELYGSDNPHMISYDNDLDIALLFAVDFDGNVIPPSRIKTGDIPVAEEIQRINKDYIWNYEKEQETYGDKLELVSDEDSTHVQYAGDEGTVWYCQDKDTYNKWRLFKCKPQQIQAIHWASDYIPQAVIQMVATNVLEVHDEVTVENITELLLEEFSQEKIKTSERRIMRCVQEIQIENNFNKRVDEHVKSIVSQHDIETKNIQLADIMREIAKTKTFNMNEMSKVYNSVVRILEG